MCGICGIYNLNSNTSIDRNLITRMAEKLVHRGPDAQGIMVDTDVALGHRRLSIIDLSAAGQQPMYNEDKTVSIVFNGEIYNFLEWREYLIKKGHKFQSKTDTEIIIHLYEEFGVDCLEKLRGMFAFAIWDKNKKRMFLARDRVGKKPLVYTFCNNSFYFASEIKSLLEVPGLSRELDYDALLRYLTFVFVPYPYTMFKNIRKLPPASYMLIENGRETIRQYWHIEPQKVSHNNTELCDQLINLFDESVRLRLISDVPLGAMLSGGVDSSSVVAFARKYSQGPIKTFSVGFESEEKKDPEFPYAQMVSEKFGTEHYPILVKPDLLNLLPKVLQYFDEPCANYTMLHDYMLAKEIRKHVTVVLSGDGGDEIFGGYKSYTLQRQFMLMHRLINILPLKLLNLIIPPDNAWSKKIKTITLPIEEVRVTGTNNYAQSLYKMFMMPGLSIDIKLGAVYQQIYKDNKFLDYDNAYMFMDLMYNHQHNVVLLSDICGMANSLEMRCPFLDQKLIEFGYSLPVNKKVPNMFSSKNNKYLLKKSLHNILPEAVLTRKKMGFGYAIPYANWLRNDWKVTIEKNILQDNCLHQVIRKDTVNTIWAQFLAGDNSHAVTIWTLLVLKVWLDIYVQNKPVEEIFCD